MKKAALFLSAALLSLLSPASAGGFVTYAYLPRAAVLYTAAGEAVCTLPATYFVLPEGSAAEGRYPVSYLDLRGYMVASDLEIVDYEPVTKFASLTARPQNDGMAVNLRSAPNVAADNVLAAVPADAVLTLYGGREGGELFAGAGKLWQYVRYDGADGAVYGYIYAAQLKCDALQPNVIEKVQRPPEQTADETPAAVSLGNAGTVALIAAMCVPAGLLMLVLFYRPDSKRTPRHSRER